MPHNNYQCSPDFNAFIPFHHEQVDTSSINGDIPLKKNIIHNIEMVVADYTSDRIAAAVDRVLISTDETDEKVLTRVVMKLLTDSEKETPTKKQKSKKKPLQTSDMVKFIVE